MNAHLKRSLQIERNQMNETICQWCEEVVKYESGSVIDGLIDYDYDGNTIIYSAVSCPHCTNLTKVF